MDCRLLSVATQIMVIAIIMVVILLFIGIGVLVLLHICIVGRAFRRGLSTMSRERRCGNEPSGLSPEEVDGLPCYEFFDSCDAGDCVVCLESFRKGDQCRLLPGCGHSFHAVCVDSWLVRAPICPICRTTACRQKGKKGLERGGVGFELREGGSVVVIGL